MTPRNWNSQVGYRRELMPDVGIDVSFLYNRGNDHVGIVNINAGVPGTASSTGANPVRPDPNFVTKSRSISSPTGATSTATASPATGSNESLCIPRTGVVACPGFNYSRNSARELSTDEANALRALFGQTPIERYENNPQYFNVDATLQKMFRFGRHGVRLTVEAFNVFNIAQRTAPNISILISLFGTYSAVEGPRAIQFTAQYDF